MNGIVLVVGCALLLVEEPHAASFDCEVAKTPMEKAICHDKLLSRLDDSLNQAYNVMRDSAADPISLRNQQRAWLSGLRKKYKPGFDLASAYRLRFAAIMKTPIYTWKRYSNQALQIEFEYPANRVIQVDEEKHSLKIMQALAKEEDFDVEMEILEGNFEDLANSKGFENRKDGWYYPNSRCGDAKAALVSGPGWKGYYAESDYGTSDESGMHACAASMESALLSNGQNSIAFYVYGADNAGLYARTLHSLRILP